jgi:phosphate transport system protein
MFNFKELIELWRTDNLLDQALNNSYTMLESTREMLSESIRSLRHSDTGDMNLNVYEKDQQVNLYEQKVRRKVTKHLAITGGVNIIPGLILTSIVIDVERIGDYTKNMMDLAIAHPKRLVCGNAEERICKIEKATQELFDKVIPVFKDTDKDAARALISDNLWILKSCDEILMEMIKGEDPSLSQSDAVSTGVYSRYLKRTAAHLVNIASSVVNPFESIGFSPEKD